MRNVFKYSSIVLWLFLSFNSATGQMVIGADTLYGNEWIKNGQMYYKFPVSDDRIYRISYATLEMAGVPMNTVRGENFQIFRLGKELNIYTSSDSLFGENDFIEFYAKRMRSELDQYLYNDPNNELLNPDYSIINDTISCFLTWNNKTDNKRLVNLDNDVTTPGLPVTESSTTILNSFPNARIKPGGVYTGINSRFDIGEGYGSSISKNFTTQIAVPFISPNADSIQLGVRLYTDEGSHEISFSLNDQLIALKTINNSLVFDTTIHVAVSILNSSNNLIITDSDPNTKGFSISNIKVNYTRSFDFAGTSRYEFEIDGSKDVSYIEMNGFYQGGPSPILYNFKNSYRILGILEAGKTKFNLPPSPASQDMLMHSGATILNVETLKLISFKDYTGVNADYIIISHPALFDDGNGNNYVQQYADYRSSAAGGNHQVVVIEINELYDQFAYGNDRHFISVRNFAHFIQKKWSLAKSIFLIGKGREYAYVRNPGNLKDPSNRTFFIPTFGTPGSDNLLVVTQGQIAPILAIGRIAAQTGQDIGDYLQKMKDFESNGKGQQTIKDQLWKKEVIHLGGGASKSEQKAFQSLLQGITPVIENNKFGAHVTGFYKTSTDPIQISQNQLIFDRINSGVSIITFLGHSAVGTFDFSIDNPQNYQNFAKYPLMFSLGCYSGNYHTAGRGTGENFCFYKNKGALGFVATSYTGYPSILSQFTEEFYHQLGTAGYGQSVGENLKYTYRELSKSGSDYVRSLTEQMSFHGDPEYTIHVSSGPDYTPDIGSLKLDPPVVTVQTDSIRLSFEVINLGTNIKDSISVNIRQKLPGGEIRELKTFELECPAFKSKIDLKFPSFKRDAFGLNTFLIDIDKNNEVTELPDPEAEMNNSISQGGVQGYNFYVTDNTAIPISPPDYSIVKNPQFELFASTADPLAKSNTYLIQIDTTKLFNSPRLVSKAISQKGGLIRWQPSLQMLDSVVYYWRITPDSTSTGVGALWQYSSFFYRPTSPEGWSVGHNFQFNEGILSNLKPVGSDQKMNFIEDVKDVFVQNFVRKPEAYPAYYINNGLAEINYGNDILAGVYVGVIDPTFGTQWLNPKGGKYGSETPADWRQRGAYPYTTSNPEKRKSLISFLKDTIPDGHFVVFFTIQDETKNYKPEDWAIDSVTLGTNIFQVLENQGAKLIRQTVGNAVPYSFVYKKGVKPLGESLAENINSVANLNVGIDGSWDRGSFKSKPVGPASNWDHLSWSVFEKKNEGDSTSVQIYGLDQTKTNKFLLKNLSGQSNIDLKDIDAKLYPYLECSVFLKDSLFKSSPNLNYIRIYYQGVTELAVEPNNGFIFYKDTIDQGDELKLSLPINNISNVNADSVLVKYVLTGPDQSQDVFLYKESPILKNQKQNINYSKNTLQLKGNYKLDIIVNPEMQQPEQYSFNNLTALNFTVIPDKRSPQLNVTFDGVRILNGDIVSAKPEICIQLKDENKYIALKDTGIFKVFLKYPGELNFKSIPINDPQTSFIPASSVDKQNSAKLIFKPLNLINGEHELLVQAKDATGNASGNSDYSVKFKVITEQSISSFLPYPNPFTSSASFVYTLTGDKMPEHIRVRIYSVSGTLVKEITERELGNMKIGTHVTDYKWDGTDMYGNKLGNGVYLYQVVCKDAFGGEWKSFENQSDNFMDKGFGKIVILR